MEKMLLRVFQHQVAIQCDYANRSAVEMDNSMHTDPDEFWRACQAFLSCAANVSKALWGVSGKGAPARVALRAPLRESLGVADDSPIRDVGMRNNFEHLDERLIEWWETSILHNYADGMIGSRDIVTGLDPRDMFRLFDAENMHLVFWGQEFELIPLAQALAAIHPIAVRESMKSHAP